MSIATAKLVVYTVTFGNLQSNYPWVLWYSFCCDMIEGDNCQVQLYTLFLLQKWAFFIIQNAFSHMYDSGYVENSATTLGIHVYVQTYVTYKRILSTKGSIYTYKESLSTYRGMRLRRNGVLARNRSLRHKQSLVSEKELQQQSNKQRIFHTI